MTARSAFALQVHWNIQRLSRACETKSSLFSSPASNFRFRERDSHAKVFSSARELQTPAPGVCLFYERVKVRRVECDCSNFIMENHMIVGSSLAENLNEIVDVWWFFFQVKKNKKFIWLQH